MPDIIKPAKGSSLHRAMSRVKAQQADELIPFIDSYLTAHRNTGTYTVVNEEKVADTYFHPSATDKCARLLYFQLSGKYKLEGEDYSPTTIRTFHIGQAIHSLVQKWVEEMGKIPGYPKSILGAEALAFSPELNVRGSIDDVIEFPSGNVYVVDYKTMNSAQFNRLTAALEKHQEQVMVYMHILGIKQAIVLYISKDFPHDMKEYRIEYDAAKANRILRRWGKVKEALIADSCEYLEYDCKAGSTKYERCPARAFCKTVVK